MRHAQKVGGRLGRTADTGELGHFPGLDAELIEALDNALGNGIVAASGAQRGLAALVTQDFEADAVGLLRRSRGNRGCAHKPSCRTMSSVTVRASSGSPP